MASQGIRFGATAMGIDLRNGNKGYELNLGWKAREYPSDGWWDHANEIEVIQHRFYLGSKKDAAEVAALRLEQFWKQVKDNQHVAFANIEMDFGTSKLYGKPPRPLWSPLTLEMAKAIAKGATTFNVSRACAKQENLEYVKYLANLRRAFCVGRVDVVVKFQNHVAFRPADAFVPVAGR
jgi:hypothetical protein